MGRKKKQKPRPPKLASFLTAARERIARGSFRDTRHASDRKSERSITLPEIKQVISAGYHEATEDEFNEEHNAWNYAIRGRTIDRRELRIVVSFDEEGQLIFVTTRDLDAERAE